METKCASPERSDRDEILREHSLFFKDKIYDTLYSAIPNIILILDRNRQIVFYNAALLNVLGIDDSKRVLGMRPGELLSCIHSCETEGGCGTAEACCNCGALQAFLIGFDGTRNEQECRLTVRGSTSDVSFDLKISASPIEIAGEHFVTIHLTDISDQKRRRVLERIFFHDVINTAGNIMQLSELLSSGMGSVEDVSPLLGSVSKRLLDEISSQRELLAAESGELVAHREPVSAQQLLDDAHDFYSAFSSDVRVSMVFDPLMKECILHTDRVLAGRVIGNMLKNALEASKPGEVVAVKCELTDDKAVFRVHNRGFISRDAALQIFKRSYSSKGIGHGIGTYSMKLIGEKYLGGKVSFETSEQNGTVFSLELPV